MAIIIYFSYFVYIQQTKIKMGEEEFDEVFMKKRTKTRKKCMLFFS